MTKDFVKERQMHLARYAYALMSVGVDPKDFRAKMADDLKAIYAEGEMMKQVVKEAQS